MGQITVSGYVRAIDYSLNFKLVLAASGWATLCRTSLHKSGGSHGSENKEGSTCFSISREINLLLSSLGPTISWTTVFVQGGLPAFAGSSAVC